MKNKNFMLISLIVIFVLIVIYIFYPVPNCKMLDEPVEGNATYLVEDIEKIHKESIMNLNTIGNSMYPTILENSQCLCIEKENYEVKDIIFFFEKINGQLTGVTHRIVYILSNDRVITKGDNNEYLDDPVNREDIVCAIPKIVRWRTWF